MYIYIYCVSTNIYVDIYDYAYVYSCKVSRIATEASLKGFERINKELTFYKHGSFTPFERDRLLKPISYG